MSEKLVRDWIPWIIRSQGRDCECRVADDDEYPRMLMEKLDEEVAEFKAERNLEELADIMEVLFALAKEMGYSDSDLIEENARKRGERGSFEDRIVLRMDRGSTWMTVNPADGSPRWVRHPCMMVGTAPEGA